RSTSPHLSPTQPYRTTTPPAQLSSTHTTPPSRLSTLSLHDALPISVNTVWVTTACPTSVDTISGVQDLYVRFKVTMSAHRGPGRSEEHTSELQSRVDVVCRLLLDKKKTKEEAGQRNESECDTVRRDS